DAAWAELNDFRNRPTPKATVEAVVHAVRERGLAALKEPTTVERLKRCDAAARADTNQRIEKLGLKPCLTTLLAKHSQMQSGSLMPQTPTLGARHSYLFHHSQWTRKRGCS